MLRQISSKGIELLFTDEGVIHATQLRNGFGVGLQDENAIANSASSISLDSAGVDMEYATNETSGQSTHWLRKPQQVLAEGSIHGTDSSNHRPRNSRCPRFA